MSDTYQAVYDAVRSRISNGDVGHAISQAIGGSFDISHQKAIVVEAFVSAANEMQRPSVLFKPTLEADFGHIGGPWVATYQGRKVAVGKTMAEAMEKFDLNWGRTWDELVEKGNF